MITVVGAAGYIGNALTEHLAAAGITHKAVRRDIAALYDGALGTVIYCAGVTTDFADRPFETVEAHAAQLCDIFAKSRFDQFVYLSSTRVYMGGAATNEDATISVQPGNPDHLYNLSKLLGENLCRYSPKPAKVVRLSNVYGFDVSATNFLPIIIRQALTKGEILFETSLESAKDYISLGSAIDLMLAIAERGKSPTYNLASGRNISHGEIAGVIARVTGCGIRVRDGARPVVFPPIDVARLRAEFGEPSADFLDDLPELIGKYRALA
jgi:nucleoside-diphosphate-sugar epimerase